MSTNVDSLLIVSYTLAQLHCYTEIWPKISAEQSVCVCDPRSAPLYHRDLTRCHIYILHIYIYTYYTPGTCPKPHLKQHCMYRFIYRPLGINLSVLVLIIPTPVADVDCVAPVCAKHYMYSPVGDPRCHPMYIPTYLCHPKCITLFLCKK